jgi:hypothetical protein
MTMIDCPRCGQTLPLLGHIIRELPTHSPGQVRWIPGSSACKGTGLSHGEIEQITNPALAQRRQRNASTQQ